MATFQIDGLASGIRTAEVINKLIAVERQPLQRIQAQQSAANARKSAVQTLNQRLASLGTALADLMRAGTLNQKVVTTSTTGPSTAAVGVSAGAAAANGSFAVSVKQLATATQVSSSGVLGEPINAGTLLKDAGLAVPLTTTGGGTSGTFSINGVAVTVDPDVDSLSDVVARINATVPGVTAEITNAAGLVDPSGNHLKLSSGAAMTLGAGADTSNFLTATRLLAAQPKAASVTGGVVSAGALAATALHINGVIVTTRATAIGNTAAQNAASLAADINGTSGIGVNAVANQDGTLTLTARTGGVGSSVSITQAGTGTGLSVGTVTQTSDVYVSTAGLATSQAGVNLPESRLAAALGFDADGNGAFKINGVSISYSNSDSLNAVLSRITASAAGVTASYDPLSDRVTMTSKNTGSVGISLEDVTGNFLQATGLLGTSQTLGKNAVFSVSSLQGGADLTSTSNIVSGILPGVDLTLNQVTTAPIEVSVSQNVNGTASAVQSFVSAFNATLAHVRSISRIDPSGKDAGILSTDSTVRGIEAGLRSMLVQQATGMSGKYQSLADIGLSFGAIGSAAGGTNDLVFDSAKFSAAMNDNPDAVASLLSGFRSTVTLAPGGTALASVSGQPASTREPGSYLIRTFTGGSISATFTPLNGSPGPEVFGSAIAGGGSDSLVIPGMTLTATNPLVDGESTITVAVQQKGILVALQDYLGRLTRSGGTLASKSTSIEAQVSDYQKRIEAAEARIAQKKARFEAQFAALETMMSRLQAQNSALMGQLQQLNNATRR